MAKGNAAASKRDVAGATAAEISESENMESVADEPLLHEFNKNPKSPDEEREDKSTPKNRQQDDDGKTRAAKTKRKRLYDHASSARVGDA